MKNCLIISILSLNFIVGNAQQIDVTTLSELSGEPCKLIIPEGWTKEQFPIPISFAQEISYVGMEDIRFSPGWANPFSDEYWTYAFLWYLDGHQTIDADTIERHLKSYYTGLIMVNSDHIQNEKMSLVTASFKQKKTTHNDLKTFFGTIEMNDYKNGKPITLHCVVHVESYFEVNKTVLFFELSPKPFENIQWKILDEIWLNFSFN